jgi:TPR repeat protein
LGLKYAEGTGVPKDDVNAYAWLNVASANGDDLASKNRDFLAKRMTPEQIAEAQKLSKVWFEKFQPKE